jgi:AcrR family transcriptional regulator
MKELGFEEVARSSFGAGGAVGAVVGRLPSGTRAIDQADPHDITHVRRSLTPGGFDMGRRKLVADDELLAVAREVFVKKGIAAPTREIARRAGISEAVIYQRHPTKAHLFFAAMVPPASDVEDLLSAPANGLSVVEQLERIALGMMGYFREVMPILMRLVTHPEFDLEKFAQRHPDSPFGRMHLGLIQHLESQRERGSIAAENVGPAALTLFAALHSLAFLERLGVHGGRFDDATIRAMVRSLWTGLAPRSE